MKGSHLRALSLVLGSLGICQLAACRPAGGAVASSAVVDDAGVRLSLAHPPRRIASLNPVTTELLFALGAGDRIAGRSDACDYPPAASSVPSLGGGFPPAIEAVAAIRPDLVVLYQSPGNAPAAERLRQLGIPVLRLRTDRLADVARAARTLGAAVGAAAAGDSIARTMRRELALARAAAPDSAGRLPAVLLAWDQPAVVLGTGSFAHEVLELAGGRNVFADLAAASAPVSLEVIAARGPEAILVVGSEISGLERRAEWRSLPAVRAGRVLRLTESSSNRPSPRAPGAIRALRQKLAAIQSESTSGDPR